MGGSTTAQQNAPVLYETGEKLGREAHRLAASGPLSANSPDKVVRPVGG